MLKKRLIALCILQALSMPAFTNPPPDYDDDGGGGSLTDDHGNTRAAATNINSNSNTAGIINYGNDNDYMKVYVPNAGTLKVYTTGSTDTFGYLLDSQGNQLTMNDDGGSGTNFSFTHDVTAGTYYVRVRGYGTSTTGQYNLKVELEQQILDDDHGNNRQTATPINHNSSTTGIINYQNDPDYMKVDVPTSGTLKVKTTGNTDTYGYLFDENGNELIKNDDGGFGTNFSFNHFVTAGTYYVKVRGYSSSTLGNYNLDVELEESEPASDDHGSCDSATVLNHLPYNDEVQIHYPSVFGSLDYPGDEDCIKITVPVKASMNIYTTGNTDTYGSILGEAASDDDLGEGTNFQISQILLEGEYYIKIRGGDTSSTGAYWLNIRAFRHNSDQGGI